MTAAPDELWDGRYRLVSRIGAGGMASVWLAHDERLDRRVALKLLAERLAGDEEYLRRFEREAQVAARLNHPNLVPVFDFAVAEERPYLVMEYVSGGSLADRARDLSAADVELIARELLAALTHIHDAGIVHRDLKPANVLVDERGRHRLTDFGIAQPDDATSLTQTGQLIGTIRYMAPEVRVGEPATVRSDLYSLGVLLRDCGAESAPALAPLLAALGEADPALRPGSAAEAAALLQRATAPTRRIVAPATARRRPALGPLLLAALAAVAIVAAALAVTGGDDEPRGGSEGQAPLGREEAPNDEPPAEPADPEPPQAEGPEPEPAPTPPTCAELEAQKEAAKEDQKAAEESAGDDKEAKEAIKEESKAREKELEEQLKQCEE